MFCISGLFSFPVSLHLVWVALAARLFVGRVFAIFFFFIAINRLFGFTAKLLMKLNIVSR